MRHVEKVRFGSGAERLLHDMPSNGDRNEPPLRGGRPGRWRRRILVAAIFIALLPLLVIGLVKTGVIAPLIENRAIAALNAALPDDLTADIGSSEVVAERFGGIAVNLDKFAVRETLSGRDILEVGRTTIGVKTMSVLRGSPQVEKIALSGVRFAVPAAGGDDGGQMPRIASIETGLSRLLDSVNMLFERTTINGLRVDVEIADMTVVGAGQDILVRNAVIVARPGQRAIEADVEIEGHHSELVGVLQRSPSGALTARLRVDGVPLAAGRMRTVFSAVTSDHLPGAASDPLLANLSVSARRLRGDNPDQMSISVEPVDYALKLDNGDFVPVSGRFNLDWKPATKVLSLRESTLRIGRSSAIVTGGIRDVAASADAPSPLYEFEALTNDGVSNPADSPERGIKFRAKVSGTFSPTERLIDLSHIEVSSEAGNFEGAGTFDLAEMTPTAIFAISIEDFALAGVKQFWPAPVARAARRWVMSNLAGGRVVKGDFLIAEPLRRRIPGTDRTLEGDTELSLDVEGVRFDVTGNIPPVRDAKGRIEVKGGETIVTLDSGTAYLPSGRTAAASNGTLTIHRPDANDLVHVDLDVFVSGTADALGELISYRPISAQQYRDYEPDELSGLADARVTMQFVLNPREDTPPLEWNVILDLKDAAISTPFEGRMLSEMDGRIVIDRTQADIDVSGKIDGVPANIVMVQPFGGVSQSSRDIVLNLTDDDRKRIASGLDTLVFGTTPVSVKSGEEGEPMAVEADLSRAKLSLPWIGWSKGSGIDAKTSFDLVLSDDETRINEFKLDGPSFSAEGDITVGKDGLQNARFAKVKLNKGDDVAVDVEAKGKGFLVNVTGKSFDARALIRHVRETLKAKEHEEGVPVELNASIGKVTGFGDEYLRDVKVRMQYDGSDVVEVTATAMTRSGFPISVALKGAAAKRTIRGESLDAGEILRFLDIYGQVRGGIMNLSLKAVGEDTLTGTADMTDFRIFDEPRLNALVSSKSDGGASLNEAIRRDIDTREVEFDRASATLTISPYRLDIKDGAIRGPLVGSTFRGTLYDKNDRMRIAGTFMPAYAANSLLPGIPILGLVLGNGRDRALIGVTYLLEGDMKKPKITVNPLSAIAPGVFRSIFEFR
ncbi:MAG: hypothetical protein CL534_09385 [Ahrensia sp.]|nr:hypothetical protein [Ahrensia sp.]